MIRAATTALALLGVAAGLVLLPAATPAYADPVKPAATPTPSPSPTGDATRTAEYWLDQYGITGAWKKTQGEGVTIAVIDTGVAKVPELDDAVVGGTDVSGAGTPDGRTPVGVVDKNHGTWVAALAASRGTGPMTGMIGVAPKANILSVSLGLGSAATVPVTEQVAKAMRWAVDNGADIINLSFTTNSLSWDQSWDSAFQYAYDHDVVVVVAAGNRGSGTATVGAPATIPGVLTVAGVDPKGRASVKASTQGITIGVAAPSEKLLGISPDDKLVTWAGTSGAAPIVAGIAALVRSAHPDLDANNVINRIIRTASAPPDHEQTPDPVYGYGLVNASAAVNASVPSVDKNPMGSLADWVRVYRRADAIPNPQPQQPGVAKVEPLPAADPRTDPGSPFLPSRESIMTGTIPLMAVTLPGILIVLGVIAVVRRVRSARHSRTPNS